MWTPALTERQERAGYRSPARTTRSRRYNLTLAAFLLIGELP
jgi:hypothetical protein